MLRHVVCPCPGARPHATSLNAQIGYAKDITTVLLCPLDHQAEGGTLGGHALGPRFNDGLMGWYEAVAPPVVTLTLEDPEPTMDTLLQAGWTARIGSQGSASLTPPIARSTYGDAYQPP